MNRTSKVVLVLVVGLTLMGSLLTNPAVWNSTWEASPTNTDPVSQGDDAMRARATALRERLEVEHEIGTGFSGVSGDNGQHRVGSARCFIQNTAPTLLEDGDAPLDYDNTGGAGTATLSANESVRSPSRTVGHGRCWIDINGPDNTASTDDDYSLYVYNAGWQQVTNGSSLTLLRSFNSHNLLRNSSFEVMNSSSTAPDGWTAINTPTISYAAATQTEGEGQYVQVTAAGSADEGLRQTLSGLKGSHVYAVVGRANATSAADTCSIRTTGATSNASDTTATTGAFEDLVSTFTTDASATDVLLFAEANADTDVCRFDKLGVFELGSTTYSPLIPSSSSWSDSVSITGAVVGDQASAETVVLAQAQTYTIESPNCWIDARANVSINSATGDPDSTTLALRAAVNGGAITTIESVNPSVLSGSGTVMRNVEVAARVEYPTPGDTYAFNLSGIDADASAGTDITVLSSNSLYITMTCPGD